MFGNARIIRFAALSLALLTVAASAETFTVALDLSGYPNIQFDIGRRFSSIQSVTFTCNGTMLAGLDYRGQPFSGQVVLWLRANPGYKIAEGPLAGQSTYPAAEPFTGQSSFRSLIGATWDFLLDGTGDGWFEIEPSLFLPEQQPLSLPSATIHSAALIIEATPVPTPIIYVDDDAPTPGDGRSWQTAYKYLQDALMMAVPPAEIRVAQGTYKPDQFVLSHRSNLGRDETFQLRNNVTLKGGYAGLGQPDPNARDVRLYETILSGDRDGNDVELDNPEQLVTEPTRAENSYRVVTGSGINATAVLDGFTITAGNANYAEFSQCNGAGMYNDRASPTVVDCTFIMNFAGDDDGGGMGAAMFNHESHPALTGCNFIANAAIALDGGEGGGGAIGNSFSNPTLTNCTFIANICGRDGGGMWNYQCSPVLVNCLFAGNLARQGGSGSYGGGIWSYGGALRLSNCTFAGNVASSTHVGDGGGAMHCEYLDELTLLNSILRGNRGTQDPQITLRYCDAVSIRYCNIEGGSPQPGEGNMDADPRFAAAGGWDANGTPDDPADDRWTNGDYRVKSQGGRWDPATQSWVIDDVTSPCIDAGDPMTPIGPEPFPNGGRINMGAYGGTAEASKSYFNAPPCETIMPGDINGDCKVDLADFAILALHWLETSQ